MSPRHFLILLAVASSLAGAGAGSSANFGDGFTAVPAAAKFKPFGPNCSTTGNYTRNSQYQVNLGNLMGDLRSGATANGGFDDGVAGQEPDTVFGLIMCYADSNLTQCMNCLQTATTGVTLICPYSREMKAFDDACVIRYSNEPFFSVADLTDANYTSDGNFVTDMAAMNTTRWRLLFKLADEAAVSKSELRFANGSTRYKDSQGTSQVIYGLAQCTRDLNASECIKCLTTFMEGLSSNTYGTAKGYSCYVAYKIGEDLGITMSQALAAAPRPLITISPAPPPLPLPSMTPRPQGLYFSMNLLLAFHRALNTREHTRTQRFEVFRYTI